LRSASKFSDASRLWNFRAVREVFRAAIDGLRAVGEGFRAAIDRLRAAVDGFKTVGKGVRAVREGSRAVRTGSMSHVWNSRRVVMLRGASNFSDASRLWCLEHSEKGQKQSRKGSEQP